ncbi:Peptidase family M28 [Nannocystis exedens]|uniref:Peptidase family M28 n=1 Tax=Nannocystis exedens TaxID=54 RepID=A0A1I1SZ02_9BACT|nr:M28 family peptidase [Nannocystis exedens]PCC66891.1 glutamine cyclotransferase [Nannocystis exedens]SFD51685.1 Peptidase family M28 [Nannocystis exedens]
MHLRSLLAFAGLVLACGRPPGLPSSGLAGSADTGERFSGAAALARVDLLLDRYPRALGDARRAGAIEALAVDLQAAGAAVVDRLEHRGADPLTGVGFDMTTLLGHVRPEAPRRFILATHFDTRPWAESDPDPSRRDQPIIGANDGTSGLAVVLELVPLLVRQLPPDIGLTVILFDGEELGRPELGPYLAGSRALATEVLQGRFPLVARAEFGVVLDMVGDRDLRIQPDRASLAQHPALIERIWSIGQAHGFTAFDPAPLAVPLLDDHVPLDEAGVPSILLIDYDYPAWHTHADTRDKLDARSLGAVGETLRLAFLDLAARPLPSPRS